MNESIVASYEPLAAGDSHEVGFMLDGWQSPEEFDRDAEAWYIAWHDGNLSLTHLPPAII